MFSKLWGWVAAAFMFLVAGLFLVIGQRDKAKRMEEKAKAKTVAVEKTRKTENSIREAQEQAREKTVQIEEKRNERPKDERPSGSMRRR